MIQGILSICFDILEWLIGLFPSFEFVNNFVSSLNAISGILYEASPFVPFRDIFICIGLISSFYIGLFGMKCINWIIHRIPFIN
jgi:hypothetical protein